MTSELRDDEIVLELLNQTNGLLHSIHLKPYNFSKEIISLLDTYDKACQGFFGWFSYMSSSLNKGRTAPAIFLTMLLVRVAFSMLQMLPPLGRQASKMYTTLAILCSESSPLVKFYHGP